MGEYACGTHEPRVLAHVPILGVDIWEHVRGWIARIVSRRLLIVLLQAFYLQVSLNGGHGLSRPDRCLAQSITMSRPT